MHPFADTPFPIDPFKFVATSALIPLQEGKAAVAAGQPLETQFAVPALPDRLTKPNPEGSPSVKRTPAVTIPKTPFPDAHLPVLVAKIQAMQTGNIAGIVETVYQDLRAHKVKKNAIEAKLKEVGEKSKEKKIWVVKSEYLVSPLTTLHQAISIDPAALACKYVLTRCLFRITSCFVIVYSLRAHHII